MIALRRRVRGEGREAVRDRCVGWVAWLALGLAGTLGCSTPEYREPDLDVEAPQLFVEIELPFVEVWRSTLEQFGTTDEEATTGRMTFPFGSIEEAAKYVDCGWIERGDFKGPFIDYLRQEGEAQFRGRIDLRVGKIRRGLTRVSIHARYTISATSKGVDRFTPQTYSWAFASGGSATVRTRRWMTRGKWVSRTCRPTYAAEREALHKLPKP